MYHLPWGKFPVRAAHMPPFRSRGMTGNRPLTSTMVVAGFHRNHYIMWSKKCQFLRIKRPWRFGWPPGAFLQNYDKNICCAERWPINRNKNGLYCKLFNTPIFASIAINIIHTKNEMPQNIMTLIGETLLSVFSATKSSIKPSTKAKISSKNTATRDGVKIITHKLHMMQYKRMNQSQISLFLIQINSLYFKFNLCAALPL